LRRWKFSDRAVCSFHFVHVHILLFALLQDYETPCFCQRKILMLGLWTQFHILHPYKNFNLTHFFLACIIRNCVLLGQCLNTLHQYCILLSIELTNLRKLKNEVKNSISNDPAHDFKHTMRVYKNAERLSNIENANTKLVLCAALLHDIVSFPKSDKRSKNSSIKSAIKAVKILKKYNLSKNEIRTISLMVIMI